MFCPQKVSRKRLSLCMSENGNISAGTNAFKHAESKSKEFPLRRPTVFSQTAILSLPISRQFFFIVQRHGWMKTRGCITQND